MAQEAGDAICLQYALGWLHLINEQREGNGMALSFLMMRQFVVASDRNYFSLTFSITQYRSILWLVISGGNHNERHQKVKRTASPVSLLAWDSGNLFTV